MAVTLDHTIVQATDNLASARFLADILGLPGPDSPAHFAPVATDNDVVLDFMTVDAVMPHHYAFTVSPATFDEALARVRARGITIFAEPDRSGEGKTYARVGRRGFYFDDPDRNLMEVIERSESDVDHEISELTDSWAAAETEGDLEILDDILSDDFRGIGPLGFVLDKAAWLKRFAGGLHNKSVSFEGLQVTTQSPGATVAVGVFSQQATFNDFDSSGQYRISFLAMKHRGRWQVASCHLGSLDPQAVAW
jgi:catechol 2,3-dioxygenase-like lactoylglutathione lyase family enzyme